MSWFSRKGGTWSPFGRGATTSDNQVSDSDFSYITSEDLATHTKDSHHRRHRSASRTAAPEIVDWDDKNPDRDTDILVFKNGRVSYPTHFPAQSIRDGELQIGTVRQAAAKKLGVSDPRKIRMFFKGRNMKFDDRAAREEGLRGDGQGSEILCVVGADTAGVMAPGSTDPQITVDGASDDDEDDTDGVEDSEGIAGTAMGASGPKKPRKRGGRKKKGKKSNNASATASSTNLGYSSSTTGNAEFLPTPSSIPNPRPTSAPPANPAPAVPQTALQKLDAIASNFHTKLVPQCIQFTANPPSEKAKRDFEHKKLTETILAQVLLKLDGVETGGDEEARATRKALVKETQAMLGRLDEVVKLKA